MDAPSSINPGSILILGIVCLLLLNACVSPLERSFQSNPLFNAPKASPWAAALRALDLADTATPAHDITAVYLHKDIEYLLIRIDLLDFQSASDISLDIRIGDDSTPEATSLDIHIPSESDSARVSLGPLLDTVIVEVPLSAISSHPRVDISTPTDQITGLTLDGPIPDATAPLLLTFYDTFTARFPAEALRSWDGAHTGPRGERHGLKHLLDAAEKYQIPIVLLDLKEPESLSALDATGLTAYIETLEQQDLLILPQNNIDNIQFSHLEDSSHLYSPLFRKTTHIPIPEGTEATQPTPEGPSLEVRRSLLATALNADEKDLLVLGGSFQNSTWGSPDMVGNTLAYFASRPYIHVLNLDDLRHYPTIAHNTLLPQTEKAADEQTLRVQAVLELAQRWAVNPSVEAHCQDGQCVLASEMYLAQFVEQGGMLAFLFIHNDEKLIQLIGPSWQVAPGIDLYSGAFGDEKEYQTSIEGNTLVFSSLDGTRSKTYRLTNSGAEVKYETQEPVMAQISLLVDPDVRYTPGWAEKYVQANTPGGVAWGLENGLRIRIQADGPVTVRAFNEALYLLSTPEDPDFEYPPGHYIPFPMAIVEAEFRDGYFLRLEVLP